MANDLMYYRTELRKFIKDFPNLNRLLDFNSENTDGQLDLYINMALNFLNAIPPFIGEAQLENFAMPPLLIHQAAIEAMISNSILSARNELVYNNGGLTVKIPDGTRYLNILQFMIRLTDSELNSYRMMKVAANINDGWGGVFSPYSRLHGRQQTLNPNTLLSG